MLFSGRAFVTHSTQALRCSTTWTTIPSASEYWQVTDPALRLPPPPPRGSYLSSNCAEQQTSKVAATNSFACSSYQPRLSM